MAGVLRRFALQDDALATYGSGFVFLPPPTRPAIKSPAIRALLGLALGLIVGALIVWSQSAVGRAFAAAMDPVGTIWVNALRMTIVPLVVSLLITTLAEAGGGAMFSRLGRRALFVFLILLI